MISVVIPLYNKARQVKETLESVLNQTFQDFEVVIVDDGSTDNSVEVVRSISDSRIRLISQTNGGVSSARNRGIEDAKSKYIAFLDADDKWHNDYLETQVNLIHKYPQCSVFAVNYEFFDGEKFSPTVIRHLKIAGDDGVLDNYFEVAANSNPPISSISIVVRKSAILEIGGFPVGVTNGEDLITWAKLAACFNIAYSKASKAIYVLKSDYGVNSKPVNIPRGNSVGDQLEFILNNTKQNRGDLKRYISYWYKIRCNLFLRGGERRLAILQAFRAIKFSSGIYINYVYLFLCFMPNVVVDFVFRKYYGK